MTQKRKSEHPNRPPLLVGIFAGAIMFLFIVLTLAPQATAAGAFNAFLPTLFTPRGFEATLVTDAVDEITFITHAGDERIFIVEQRGRIHILHPDGEVTLFLDIRDEVVDPIAEQGLFALAFHPDYAENGYFYVSYVGEDNNNNWRLTVSRFEVSADPNVADPNSLTIMFYEPMDSPLHNGGGLAFNKDTENPLLYLGVGDDQGLLIAQENSDKGRILTLDVDRYPDVHKVRLAKGLRNPWRLTFDVNGDLFIAEVGDDSWEELNYLPPWANSRNFGWPCLEGPDIILDCALDSTQPVYAYSHAEGSAIIGGPILRDNINEPFRYVFGDFATKRVSTLEKVDGEYVATIEGYMPDELTFLFTFGTDVHGNLYAGGFGGGLFEVYIPDN